MKNGKLKKTSDDEGEKKNGYSNGHVKHMNGGVPLVNGTCHKPPKSAGIRDQVSKIPVSVHRSFLFGRAKS